MPERTYQFIGKGVYTLPDASRLTRIPPLRIRRWLEGYSYRYRGRIVKRPPVFTPATGRTLGPLTLTFSDMIEVWFLDAFIDAGVSFQTVRKAADAARKLIGRQHPFSSRHFMTDGKNILARLAHPHEMPELFDLVKNQYELDRILKPMLFRQLDFNEFDIANRWWPLGKRRQVVVDPQRSFGAPIVADVGVRTSILAASAKAERSQELAAQYFDVPVRAVRDAVDFERQFAA
jgi:uncharacterized protein (DUF433 family)